MSSLPCSLDNSVAIWFSVICCSFLFRFKVYMINHIYIGMLYHCRTLLRVLRIAVPLHNSLNKQPLINHNHGRAQCQVRFTLAAANNWTCSWNGKISTPFSCFVTSIKLSAKLMLLLLLRVHRLVIIIEIIACINDERMDKHVVWPYLLSISIPSGYSS